MNMRKLPSLTSWAHLRGLILLVAMLVIQSEHSGTAQTIDTNVPIRERYFPIMREVPRPSWSAPAHGRFDDQAAVRLVSQKTNDLFSAYDQELAGAVQKRWCILLDERAARPPAGPITLEFKVHSDGRATDLRTVQNPAGEVFALLAQKAVVAAAPYRNWPADMYRAHTNDYRIVRLSFCFQEKAK